MILSNKKIFWIGLIIGTVFCTFATFHYFLPNKTSLTFIQYKAQLKKENIDLERFNSPSTKQDNPQLIEAIQTWIDKPSELAYNLSEPNRRDFSLGQSPLVDRIFKQKRNGFFIECGAMDGEGRSNTLFLERDRGWGGLLIEGNILNYQQLKARNRKAHAIPACASIKSYPEKQYLLKYGYMNGMNERSDDNYAQLRTDALKLFQRFSGLRVTGEEDEDTRQQMLRRRCGVKDIELERPANARWNRTVIPYRFRNYAKDISQDNVRNAFVDALNQWAAASNLKFKKIEKGRPIMDIRFVKRSHRPCPYSLDGPGGVVAHAYYPHRHPWGGDIHFDDEETFKYKDGRGLSIVSVILHEAGHALGLRHEYTKGSIMVPWYTGQTTLGPNDIKRIKALYA